MIEKPITIKSDQLDANIVAYIFTILRALKREPGMMELMENFDNRFDAGQWTVMERLAGEFASLFVQYCDLRGVEPVDAFERRFYGEGIFRLPAGDEVDEQ